MVNVITYVGDDGTRWGAGKGAPATVHEHDESHFALSERIRALEENPPAAVSLASITQSGSSLNFHLTSGAVLGPFAMPVAVMRERGGWRAGRDYRRLDTVRVGGSGRYMVLQDHHSDPVFDPDREIGGDPVYYLLEESGVTFAEDIEESRELTEADLFRYRDVTGGTAFDPVTITVPEESTDAPWQPGDTAQFETRGATLEFIEGGSAVEIRCSALKQARTSDGSVCTLLYKGNDVWTLTGDLAIA